MNGQKEERLSAILVRQQLYLLRQALKEESIYLIAAALADALGLSRDLIDQDGPVSCFEDSHGRSWRVRADDSVLEGMPNVDVAVHFVRVFLYGNLEGLSIEVFLSFRVSVNGQLIKKGWGGRDREVPKIAFDIVKEVMSDVDG